MGSACGTVDILLIIFGAGVPGPECGQGCAAAPVEQWLDAVLPSLLIGGVLRHFSASVLHALPSLWRRRRRRRYRVRAGGRRCLLDPARVAQACQSPILWQVRLVNNGVSTVAARWRALSDRKG